MKKTLLITGANRGLGLATATRLLRDGHRLVVTARDEQSRDAMLGTLRVSARDADVSGYVVDLASFASVRSMAEAVVAAGHRLDVLHHNAGVLMAPEQRKVTGDGLEQTLQVNAVSPLVLSLLLRPALRSGARITAVGSSLHLPDSRGPAVNFSFEDPNLEQSYNPKVAYKNSKLALMWAMQALDEQLAPAHRTDVISPGFIPTTAAKRLRGFERFFMGVVMPRLPAATSLESAAASTAYLIGTQALGDATQGGRYFRDGAPAIASADARDPALAHEFWAFVTRAAALDCA